MGNNESTWSGLMVSGQWSLSGHVVNLHRSLGLSVCQATVIRPLPLPLYPTLYSIVLSFSYIQWCCHSLDSRPAPEWRETISYYPPPSPPSFPPWIYTVVIVLQIVRTYSLKTFTLYWSVDRSHPSRYCCYTAVGSRLSWLLFKILCFNMWDHTLYSTTLGMYTKYFRANT